MTPPCSIDPKGVPAQRTALVVDDLEEMLDLLEIALQTSNFAVLRASSASQALEIFQTRRGDIDLLMTDLRIGSDSGLELVKRVLALKPNLPVLAMSGFALHGKVVSGKTTIEFLPKPFAASELRSKLQAMFAPQPKRVVSTRSGSKGRYQIGTKRTAQLASSPEHAQTRNQ